MVTCRMLGLGGLLLAGAVAAGCGPVSTGGTGGKRGKAAAPPPASAPAQPAADYSRQAPKVAENACVRAVKRETGNQDVSVLRSEYSEANSLVTIGVGPQRAPWRCLVSNSGKVAEVSFAGSEGAL